MYIPLNLTLSSDTVLQDVQLGIIEAHAVWMTLYLLNPQPWWIDKYAGVCGIRIGMTGLVQVQVKSLKMRWFALFSELLPSYLVILTSP